MSEESKAKTSASKTGQKHKPKTRRKISRSMKKYFRTPTGKAQAERTAMFISGFWNSAEGLEYRESLGQSMRDYYEEHYKG